MVAGLVAAVELKHELETSKGDKDSIVTGNALELFGRKYPEKATILIKGMSNRVLIWHHRAAGAFLLLYPCIYGQGDYMSRADKVDNALGIAFGTARNIYKLGTKIGHTHMEKWVPITRGMKWNDVRKLFGPKWASQWQVGDDKMVTDQLKPV